LLGKTRLKPSFGVRGTPGGQLARGMGMPAIIAESPTRERLRDDLGAACECRLKSFPEDCKVRLIPTCHVGQSGMWNSCMGADGNRNVE